MWQWCISHVFMVGQSIKRAPNTPNTKSGRTRRKTVKSSLLMGTKYFLFLT